MMTFRTMFALQCRRLFTRKGARYALTVMLVMVAASLVESCVRFYGADVGEVPSAAVGWVGNMDAMQIQTMRVLYFFLIFLVAALVFADSFFVDIRSGMANTLAIRSTKRVYLASTALATFLGGFVIVCVALVLSQLLALVVFPVTAAPHAFSGSLNTPASDAAWDFVRAGNALFPSLYVNQPYLDNAIFILYASLWAGIMSFASFAVSLFTRKSRLIVLGLPTLVFLISSFVIPPAYALSYYLYPMALRQGLSQEFFYAAPVVALAAIGAAVVFAARGRKDVLL